MSHVGSFLKVDHADGERVRPHYFTQSAQRSFELSPSIPQHVLHALLGDHACCAPSHGIREVIMSCTAHCCPRIASTNPEVLGYMFTRIGSVLGSVAFLTISAALSVLAKREGGCYEWDCFDSDGDDDSACGKRERALWYCQIGENRTEEDELCAESEQCRVYGLSPTSVIASVVMVSGLVCALVLPSVGAVVDFSSKRWEVTCATGATLVFTNFIQLFLFPGTWVLMTIIQCTVGTASYFAQQLCVAAYVPELSKDPAEIPRITGPAKAWEGIAVLLFIVVVYGVVEPGLGVQGPSSQVQLARIAQVLVVVLTGPLLLVGVRRLGARPALHELPAGESLAAVGMKQTARTVTKLSREFPTFGSFFLGYMFWQSATGAIVGLAASYGIEQLGMPNIGMLSLVFIVFSIPGAICCSKIAERELLSPRASVACAIILLSVCVVTISLFIYSPETGGGMFAIMPFLGFGQGWIYPAQRNVLYALMPGGCEAEMMGFYEFMGQVLSWAPATIFIAMSEVTGTQRWALLSLPAFWLSGLAVLLLKVDVDKGIAEVASTLHLRTHGPGEVEMQRVSAEVFVHVSAEEAQEQ